jgi:hypothetical protein
LRDLVEKMHHENDGLIFTRDSVPYPAGATESIIKWKPGDMNSIDFIAVNNASWSERFGKRIVDLYVTEFNREKEEVQYIYFDFMIVNEEIYEDIAKVTGIFDTSGELEYKNNEEKQFYIIECKFAQEYRDDLLTKMLEECLSNQQGFITEILENAALSYPESYENEIRTNLNACFERKFKKMMGNWVIMRHRTDKAAPNALNTAKNVFKCIFENITVADLDKYFSKIFQQPQAFQHQNSQSYHSRPDLGDSVQKKYKQE